MVKQLKIKKVPISSFHMEGRALTWYNCMRESGPIRGWKEFVKALKLRFSPSAFDDLVRAFTKLGQTTTIEDYQSQFGVLSN